MSKLIEHDLNLEEPLIGLDEVGRGCLAGPVYAAAVHIESLTKLSTWSTKVNDSKKISSKTRSKLESYLKKYSFYSLGWAEVSEINSIGIVPASLLAMERALESLKRQISPRNYHILVDGTYTLPNCFDVQKAIIKGDEKSFHIAAASILAKTARDKLMQEMSQQTKYQEYGWYSNVGYGTLIHRQALLRYGPTAQHRLQFIRKICTEN